VLGFVCIYFTSCSIFLYLMLFHYCAFVFLGWIPEGVINQMEKILMSFLWKRGELNNSGAKVAWNLVCLPKKKASVGVKNLRAVE
jgi:hypothetical protein